MADRGTHSFSSSPEQIPNIPIYTFHHENIIEDLVSLPFPAKISYKNPHKGNITMQKPTD